MWEQTARAPALQPAGATARRREGEDHPDRDAQIPPLSTPVNAGLGDRESGDLGGHKKKNCSTYEYRGNQCSSEPSSQGGDDYPSPMSFPSRGF